MTYFSQFKPSPDPERRQRIPDPADACLPFEYLNDRDFEVLVYFLKSDAVGGSRVRLMQGTSERGRDVVVYDGEHRLSVIVQCKNLRTRLALKDLVDELAKLALHAFREPGILSDREVQYELWCPRGVTETAGDLFFEWPTGWTEAVARGAVERVSRKYARLKKLRWEQVRGAVLERFPAQTRPQLIEGTDISRRVRANTKVYREFFDAMVVAPLNEVRSAVSEEVWAAVADASGLHRQLSDVDIRRVVDRISTFPADTRHATFSGYVLGVPETLIAQLNRKEFQAFAEASTQATFSVYKAIVEALSRQALVSAGQFRQMVRPDHPAVAPALLKVMLMSAMLKLRNLPARFMPEVPAASAYQNASFDERVGAHIAEMFGEYQRCLAGYDPKVHAPASDEELRYRIAITALNGATTKETFETALRTSLRKYESELKSALERYLELVPRDLMVLTDTVTMLDDANLRTRVMDTFARLEVLRGSAILPE
ncbi:hypothetical protein ACSRUE_09155 [Sorangium sp. KYC3313]|uniref:hypothetical protein n=1 Tax=Sorangium sp. KYC3313 TaxID=3449740 RepID=UPI003F8945FC